MNVYGRLADVLRTTRGLDEDHGGTHVHEQRYPGRAGALSRYRPWGGRHPGQTAGMRSAEAEPDKFPAGGDAGLGEHVTQVESDGARRYPALRGGVLVRHALADELCDVKLGRRELDHRGGVTLPGRLTGGAQLAGSQGDQRFGAQVPEPLERLVQVPARVHATASPAQVLPIRQLGTRLLVAASGLCVVDEGTGVEIRCLVRVSEQRTSMFGHGQCPRQGGGEGERVDFGGPVSGAAVLLGRACGPRDRRDWRNGANLRQDGQSGGVHSVVRHSSPASSASPHR